MQPTHPDPLIGAKINAMILSFFFVMLMASGDDTMTWPWCIGFFLFFYVVLYYIILIFFPKL
jgi:uncharacterized membrane protein YdbT with pleckstrin-like domain